MADDIAARYREVDQRVAQAAQRAGRQREDIVLVAVSKTRSIDKIRQAITAGARHLGENYVQELVDKHSQLDGCPDARAQWHAIGHLQRNKVRFIAPFCDMIHAVDSARLGDEIDRRARQCQRKQPLLIEVNIAAEGSKFGLEPNEVAPLAEYLSNLPNLELRGLMAMTPYQAQPDESRRYFAGVRELAARLAPELPSGAMSQLSMGMTQDFEVAVEEGATLVRVGTAIFGPRENT